jgi:hypothetical protein
MTARRIAFALAVVIILAGCDLVVPIPPYTYEETDSGWRGPFDGAEDWDADEERDASTDVGASDSPTTIDDDAAPDADGGQAMKNPCPSDFESCCGRTEEAGAGALWCLGAARIAEGICDKCLALPDCDASTSFCCAPGGDNPAVCMPLSRAKECAN